MIVVLAVATVLVCAVALRLVIPAVRRWRMAAALRGDWWSRFEREMRAYERDWRLTTRGRRS
jgi:alpha-beta hydrolase superfamily lysophospholipase